MDKENCESIVNYKLVRKRMTRDEMFQRFPDKYILLVEWEKEFGHYYIENGSKTAFVVAVFDSRYDAHKFVNDDVKRTCNTFVIHSSDYTEEVYELGFAHAIH